jgi:signal transduction histidine kinase/ABC-type uncharacterized transport system substrate-binding protein
MTLLPRRPPFALAALTLTLVCRASGAAAEPPARPRRILEVIQRDVEVTPGYVALQTAFRASQPPEHAIDLTVETFDAARIADARYRTVFRRWVASEFAGAPPDVVVAVGEVALLFLTEEGSIPWPDVPLVFAAVDERSPALRRLPANATGFTHRYPITETVDLALALFPDTRRVVLWGGVSPADRLQAETLRGEVARYAGRLELIDLVGLPTQELLDRVRALPPGSILMGTSYNLDSEGRSWDGRDFIRTLAGVGTAPVFTVHAHLLGYGMVGGVMVDGAETGRHAMRLVARILDGEPPSEIPVERGGPYQTLLDGRVLDRWNVPAARVPGGAEIRFGEPSFRARFFWQALAGVSVIALQAVLIGALLVQRRYRRAAERRARENLAQIAHMNREGSVGELTGAFAHELNNPLGAALNNVRAAARFMAKGPEHATTVLECLEDAAKDIRRAGEVVQRIRGALRRESVGDERVEVAAVVRDAVRLIEAAARDHDVTITTDVAPELPPVAGDQVQLVQVLVNLVMNAVDALASVSRDGRRISIQAGRTPEGIELRVADNGPGVPAAQLEKVFEPFFTTKTTGLGLGLAISRSIVEAHRGTLRVAAAKGGGSVFHVSLPASESGRASA